MLRDLCTPSAPRPLFWARTSAAARASIFRPRTGCPSTHTHPFTLVALSIPSRPLICTFLHPLFFFRISQARYSLHCRANRSISSVTSPQVSIDDYTRTTCGVRVDGRHGIVELWRLRYALPVRPCPPPLCAPPRVLRPSRRRRSLARVHRCRTWLARRLPPTSANATALTPQHPALCAARPHPPQFSLCALLDRAYCLLFPLPRRPSTRAHP
ncbi:hypothetical protein FB451DRAFT_245790 [Mycena latifolia]|nr:hypothetical protein FB451DRAFT_245790 [Mycena latifolia]